MEMTEAEMDVWWDDLIARLGVILAEIQVTE
jgi:hypothetical protein